MSLDEQINIADRLFSTIAAPDGGRGNLVMRFLGEPRQFSLSMDFQVNGKIITWQGAGDTLLAAFESFRQSALRARGEQQ